MSRDEKRETGKRRLTKQQRNDLAALAAMPDDMIDLSDAPEVRDWNNAMVGRFYRPVKKAVTIRLDADVLAWVRSRGPGYQTRINRLLRAAMEAARTVAGHKRRAAE